MTKGACPRKGGREQGPEENGGRSCAPGRRLKPGDKKTEGEDGLVRVVRWV